MPLYHRLKAHILHMRGPVPQNLLIWKLTTSREGTSK